MASFSDRQRMREMIRTGCGRGVAAQDKNKDKLH